ncbi:MAG TPA: acetyl-CoA carboxylase biotin carboxyl carrier protein [Erysipelothrix sp.]|nr:acetyl-CoA carboxylase biotin carboxyl carrier protein [Erysipelothrix sp.]
MDINKIKELIELFEKTSLSSLSVKQDDSEITLTKETKSYQEAPQLPIETPSQSGHLIKSPIVGTFYRAPSPESKNFVEIGDQVNVGDVLCVIESMKMMNEITSDIQGTITHIHKNNKEMVEYDELIFTIDP